MKRLFSIIAVLVSLNAYGQGTQSQGAPTQLNSWKGAIKGDSAFYLPTSIVNFPWFDSCGRMWFNKSGDSAIYFNDCQKRVRILSLKDTVLIKQLIATMTISADSAIYGTRYWVASNFASLATLSNYVQYNDTLTKVATKTDILNAGVGYIKYSDTPSKIATHYWVGTQDSSIHIENGASQIVQMPELFDYDLPFDVLLTGNTYSINPSFSMWQRAGIAVAKTYYVDVNTGNDGNTGLSWAQAYKSLNVALAKTDVDSIAVAKGVYPYANAWRNISPTRSISIVGDLTRGTGSAVYITKSINEKLTSGWTSTSNYYSATYNNVGDTLGGVLDLSIVDSFGVPTQLSQQNSIANVNTTPGSYFVNGNTIYIRTADSRIPDANIELFGTNVSISSLNGVVTKDVTIYIKDINFRCASMYTTAPDGLGGLKIYMENSQNTYWGAFFNGTQEVMMFNVTGGNTNGDIINYDPEFGIVPKVVEYNVNFQNNLASAGTNNQASTAHQGVRILRINGVYGANAGQNVGDVDGCRSVLFGCTARNATPNASSSYLFGTGATQSYAWLDRCTSNQIPGRFAIDAAGNATVFSRNLTSNTANNIGSNSSISAYAPNETFGKKISQMQRTTVLGNNDLVTVAKSTGSSYIPAAISAADLFTNAGALLTSGAVAGAQLQPQVFSKGISSGGGTGATVAAKSLSASTPALATYAIAGQTGDRITATNASGVTDYRQKADGSIYIGPDAASGTGNFSALFSGNPTFEFGGVDQAQQVFFSIKSGTLPWSFGYQGNNLSGRLQLYRNSTERFGFNANGVFSAQTGFRINETASTSGFYLKSDGNNFISSTKAAVELNTAVPANSADPTGSVGNIIYDNSFIYIKTASGWARASLSTF